MSRQIDVRALVSHIIRGDGIDKCRICLGDTTEGQVYLGDTVTTDGDRSITLSELLESISGVEVRQESDLPSGLCQPCFEEVQKAAGFRYLCQQSSHHWKTSMRLLNMLPDLLDINVQKTAYAVLKDDEILIFQDIMEKKRKESTDSSKDNSGDEEVTKNVTKLTRRPKFGRVKKDSLTCPNCGKTFSCPMLMFQHFMHSSDGKRACYICAKIMYRDELVEHIKNDHKTKPYACKKCPGIFQTELHLNRHMKAHSPGSHYCGDCGQNFSSVYAYSGHMVIHSVEKCPVCDEVFRNHCCYLHHIRHVCEINKSAKNIHQTKNKISYEVINKKNNKKVLVGVRGSSDSQCICDYCGKKFSGKKTICAHIQIVHMKNTHQPCPHCGKLLAAAHMSAHIQKHAKIEIYICPTCNAGFKSKLGFVQHVRLHTGETPYKCDYCPETFSASSRRSEHVRKVHKKIEVTDLKHACHHCPARFRLPYKLKKHLETVHSNNAKEVEYECGQCHIKFATCRGLVNHSKRHETFSLKSLRKE